MSNDYPPRRDRPVHPDSDLFQPSLQGTRTQRGKSVNRPWRVQSQIWIAFFGGALALTFIAYQNGKRLRLSQKKQRYVLLVGGSAFLLTLLSGVVLGYANVSEMWQPGPGGTGFRLLSRGLALLAYLVVERLQRPAERVYLFSGGDHDSLWGPGLVAVLSLGTLQNVLTRLLPL